jgi:hypothetical protein
MGYRSTRIQVLLLRANDLGFGAETPKENLRNDELRTARTGSNFGAAGHLPSFLSTVPFEGRKLSVVYRGGIDDRNCLGFIPVHRLNAFVKELISRYPRSHAISEIGNSRSLR